MVNAERLQMTEIPQSINVKPSKGEYKLQFSPVQRISPITSKMQLIAIPWDAFHEHQHAFDEGIISSNGFLPELNRGDSVQLVEKCEFTEDLDKIAIGNIERGHGYLRAKSHVTVPMRA